MNTQPSANLDLLQETLSVAHSFVPLCAMKLGFLEYLLKRSRVELYCAGEVLFNRGDETATHFYLLSGQIKNLYASGHLDLVRAGDGSDYPLADELPRQCTAVAKTDATVLEIDSDELDRILSWSQISEYVMSTVSRQRDFDEDIEWIKTVLDSNLFYKVPPVNAERVISKMQSIEVFEGDVILREGEIGDCCYFIKEGVAEVSKKADANVLLPIAEIGVGRCFGEDALVYETLRNATVTMKSYGVLMKLSKEDFKLLLAEPAIEEVNEQGISAFMDPPVFIDVRSQEEYEKGHLSMAVNVPLNLLGLKQRLLREHIPYVLYCDTGRRSKAAAYLLGKQGFNAVALKGGVVGSRMQYQLVTDFSYLLKDGQVVRA